MAIAPQKRNSSTDSIRNKGTLDQWIVDDARIDEEVTSVDSQSSLLNESEGIGYDSITDRQSDLDDVVEILKRSPQVSRRSLPDNRNSKSKFPSSRVSYWRRSMMILCGMFLVGGIGLAVQFGIENDWRTFRENVWPSLQIARWRIFQDNEPKLVWANLTDQITVENDEVTFDCRHPESKLSSDELNFKLASNAPRGASIDSTSGKFTWTPTEAQGPMNYVFSVMASIKNEHGESPVVEEKEMHVRVNERFDPPTMATLDAITINEHESLAIQIEAKDINQPAIGLRYELIDSPSGMTIDERTGRLEWTPQEDNGGMNFRPAVRVSLNGDRNLDAAITRKLPIHVEESLEAPQLVVAPIEPKPETVKPDVKATVEVERQNENFDAIVEAKIDELVEARVEAILKARLVEKTEAAEVKSTEEDQNVTSDGAPPVIEPVVAEPPVIETINPFQVVEGLTEIHPPTIDTTPSVTPIQEILPTPTMSIPVSVPSPMPFTPIYGEPNRVNIAPAVLSHPTTNPAPASCHQSSKPSPVNQPRPSSPGPNPSWQSGNGNPYQAGARVSEMVKHSVQNEIKNHLPRAWTPSHRK